jgi:uncharacterized protein YacL
MNRNRVIWTTITTLCTVIGAVVGYVISSYYSQVTYVGDRLQFPRSGVRDQLVPFWTRTSPADPLVPPSALWPLFIVLTLGFAVIFVRLGSWIADHGVGFVERVRSNRETTAAVDRVLGIVGALLGMIFGVLLTLPLANRASEQGSWLFMQFGAIVVCTVFGMRLMMGMRSEMLRVFPQLDDEPKAEEPPAVIPKLLDTNIIIDGRIAEVCRTGFVEGPIWVPSFVLHEVQHIADSADPLRRSKGKRGLDVLTAISHITIPSPDGKKPPMPLVRVLTDIPPSVKGIETVDAKLVALAKEINAAIITNDFNLKPVAELQGVRVLNLNELTQSLKPVVLPGEEMDLLLVKEGNQQGQAVGYLEDGTMVVVGDASRRIGETCRVVINTLHQTVTGKMIFADLKVKDAPRSSDDYYDNGHGNGRKRR